MAVFVKISESCAIENCKMTFFFQNTSLVKEFSDVFFHTTKIYKTFLHGI